MRFLTIIFIFFIAFITFLYELSHYVNSEKLEYLDKEIGSFEVVVARYNENIDWILKEFPHDKVTIYNKGKQNLKTHSNYKIIKLPNLGREAHTYLYHIINNYDNLSDRILFLQGNPYTNHEMHFIFLPLKKYKILKETNCKAIIAKDCFLTTENKEKKLLLNLSNTKWKDVIYKSYDFIDFKRRFVDLNGSSKEYFYTNYQANFSVDKCKILSHSKEYYETLFNTLDNAAPIEGHYLERLWDVIFSNNSQSCK